MGWIARLGWAAAALLVHAAPARAAEPTGEDPTKLAALLREGEAAAKARRWEACIEAFSAALRIEDAPRTAGALGLCEQQAGRFAAGYAHLDRALDGAPAELNTEPWKTYQAALVRVRERVALLYITVEPTDAKVLLDGRPVGRADGRRIPVEPGAHTIAARMVGYEDEVKTITVAAPSSPGVDLVLERKELPAPLAAVAPLAAPSAPAPESPRGPWYRPTLSPRGALVVLMYAGIGVAVASAATSIGLEVDRQALRTSLEAGACAPSAPSPPAACGVLAERIEQRDTALAVAIGAHVTTGLLAGAARLAFGFERSATSPRVGATVSANGGGIVVLGTW